MVTEHQAEVKCCPACGQTNAGSFPFDASNVVQYGSRLKGRMVYLMEQPLLPADRTCDLLSALIGSTYWSTQASGGRFK